MVCFGALVASRDLVHFCVRGYTIVSAYDVRSTRHLVVQGQPSDQIFHLQQVLRDYLRVSSRYCRNMSTILQESLLPTIITD